MENIDSVLAIIPARKNSKRIPSKNLKIFNGFPLIYYSIRFALYSGIKNIVVSSDCDDILSYSKSLGVGTLKRPSNLSTDITPTIDVLKHVVEQYISSGYDIEVVATLQPTSPLRKKNLFMDSYLKFNENGYDSLISIGLNKKKIGIINKDQCFLPFNYKVGSRGQDLDESYFENGLIYLSLVKNILNNDLLGNKIGTIITDDISSSVDIDEYRDFIVAEFLFNQFNNYYDYLLAKF